MLFFNRTFQLVKFCFSNPAAISCVGWLSRHLCLHVICDWIGVCLHVILFVGDSQWWGSLTMVRLQIWLNAFSQSTILQKQFIIIIIIIIIIIRVRARVTTQKMKFSIKDLFSKCDQICRKLKKSWMENFTFCAVSKIYACWINIPWSIIDTFLWFT